MDELEGVCNPHHGYMNGLRGDWMIMLLNRSRFDPENYSGAPVVKESYL